MKSDGMSLWRLFPVWGRLLVYFRRMESKKRLRWTDELVEKGLQAVVAELGKWPTHQELVEVGGMKLARAVDRRGGINSWASKLGYKPRQPGSEVYWTEQRVRSTLRKFLRDRRVSFPSEREFKEAGLLGLYGTLRARGELGRWAREFRLEESRPGRPRKD